MTDQNHDKRLFLLDAFALIYRAYFAFGANQRVNSKGMNTSTVFGFANTLLDVLNNEKPTHIAVVFDTAAPTTRHDDFSDYKAGREAMPEDIAVAIPYVIKLVEGFKIPVLMSDGYEADDIIGTLAKKAEKVGYTTYMMTPDKDFGQLVSNHIYMYKPARSGKPAEVMGPKEVCAKWEIERPEQVIDILGLMGDKVDNIPGVPGVGEKTAMKLVGEYGSVEALLENTDQLKGKLKERVEENKEQAIMSKRLATILLDAPVEFEEDKLVMEPMDKEALKELFAELEFRTLAKRVFGEEEAKTVVAKASIKGQYDLFGGGDNEEETVVNDSAVVEMKTIENTKHNYKLVTTTEEQVELAKKLNAQKSFCFDTETTGIDPLEAELVGLAFSFAKTEAYYVNVPADLEGAKKIAALFKEPLENEKIEKVAQNLKYDMLIMGRYGVKVQGPLFDTMLAHYLIQPDMKHNMDILAETYLNYAPVSIETLIGKKGKNQLSMRDVSIETVKEYAAEDADITYQLKEIFEPILEKDKLNPLFKEIEVPLIPVLASMESEGINLDIEGLKTFSGELHNDLIKLQDEIHGLAGSNFNIASPKQLGEVLFDQLKIVEKPKKTKTGQYATSEDVLSGLVSKHEIVGKILDFRELQKLKSTYVDPLPTLVNKETGRLHTTYNQVVAATGRLSSDRPNLQNIPIRTERGREVRKAFVPRNDDYVLLSADYSQIELRIIAELAEAEGMIEAFSKGIDIHAATASKVFGVPLDQVDREMRSKAKAVNFGISYGQTAFGLSQSLGISRTEAKEIIDNFFAQFPGIRDYMDTSIEFARKHGYVQTMKGRKRWLKDINSANAVVRGYAERNAINSPIQGSAADMIKIAMINVHREFEKNNFKSKMLLQVHDELVFDVHKDEVEAVKPVIEEGMKNAIPMKVPVVVEMGTGQNWLEAH